MMTIEKFLESDFVKRVSNEKINFTEKARKNFIILLEHYEWRTRLSWSRQIILDFIKYDVDNYLQRFNRICKLSPKQRSSKYFYFLRAGKKGYQELYNQYIKNKRLASNVTIEYWEAKGYSKDEAKLKISEIQSINSKKCREKQKGAEREHSVRCIEYWKRMGFSEQEAKKKVSEIQNTSSKKALILKYGEKEGLLKWKEKKDKWITSLNNKSFIEKEKINLKKSHSVAGYMARGMSQEEAERQYHEYCNKHRKGYSVLANKMFEQIDKVIGEKYITYYSGKNYEKTFYNKHVDYYVEDKEICVEFYGDYWHCEPSKYPDDYIFYCKNNKIITAKDIRVRDEKRIKKILLHKKVKLILIIWEKNYIMNPEGIVNKVIKEILDDRENYKYKRIKRIS